MSKIVNGTQLNYFATGLYAKIKANFDAKGSADQALVDAKAYVDSLNTALDGRVTTVEGDVAVLKGDANTEGSVAYQIAQVVAGADASFDTLKEIADWIVNDTTGATKMANDIQANAEAIEDLEALVGAIPSDATATDIVGYIQEYVQAQLEASDLSQYAKAEDLEALEVVVNGGEVVEKILIDSIANIVYIKDATYLVDGQEYIFNNTQEIRQALNDGCTIYLLQTSTQIGLVDKMETVEAKAQANEDVIKILNGDNTVEGSVAKAVADGVIEAKDYADELNTAMDSRMTTVEGKVATNEGAIEKNAQDIAQAQTDITNNTTAIGTNASDIATLKTDVAQAQTDIAANTQAIAQAKTDLEAYADQAEADAKAYADSLDAAMTEKVNAVEDKVDTNTTNIEANAQAITEIESAIENLEAKKDTYLNATADNKYNKETGNIDLYLNDKKLLEMYQLYSEVDNNGYIFYEITEDAVYDDTHAQYFSYDDGIGFYQQIIDESYFNNLKNVGDGALFLGFNTNTNNANAVKFLKNSYSNNTLYVKYNGELVELTESNYNADTIIFVGSTSSTKVEVDMSELTNDIEANTTAISNNTSNITTNTTNITNLTTRVEAIENNIITSEEIDAIIAGLQ